MVTWDTALLACSSIRVSPMKRAFSVAVLNDNKAWLAVDAWRKMGRSRSVQGDDPPPNMTGRESFRGSPLKFSLC